MSVLTIPAFDEIKKAREEARILLEEFPLSASGHLVSFFSQLADRGLALSEINVDPELIISQAGGDMAVIPNDFFGRLVIIFEAVAEYFPSSHVSYSEALSPRLGSGYFAPRGLIHMGGCYFDLFTLKEIQPKNIPFSFDPWKAIHALRLAHIAWNPTMNWHEAKELLNAAKAYAPLPYVSALELFVCQGKATE